MCLVLRILYPLSQETLGNLRKHCYGLDFPSASPKKIYKVSKKLGSKSYYELWDGTSSEKVKFIQQDNDLLPEEKIHRFHLDHLKKIKFELLENIKDSDPAFFERLVVNLLLEMGYGWDNEESGILTGGSGDHGIDGIIREDKLGLESIYVQAKRYSSQKVPANEIRDFIGAMSVKGARKGVLFTSSDFTAQSIDHAEKAQGMNVTLVNGQGLCDLLVQYKMGVALAGQYDIFSIDKNFFDEC